MTRHQTIQVDVAIIGGSLGGVAAEGALAGRDIILTEETAWVGGQLTSQGVSAPDEHAHIERFGPRKYLELRARIRQRYIDQYGAPPVMAESVLGPDMPLNPGNGWVSRLCFTPDHAVALFAESAARRLHGYAPVEADADAGHARTVTLARADGDRVTMQARWFLDATDTGDLLPLAGVPFVTGSEARADTGEAHAVDRARADEVQGFTFPFAVEWRAGENHTIPRPDGYEAMRDSQPFTLSPIGRDGQPVVYRMFETSESGNLPFWSYRRLHDGALLGGNDIAMINWISNDYHDRDLLAADPESRLRIVDEAKRLSLGFLHWLQTECPRDDGGVGYPELLLRPDVMGSHDGLSQAPYIRESRRIVPLRRIVESDIAAEDNPGPRARFMPDSVGVGWYPIDLHPCVGSPGTSMYAPTRPFQIPLGALIPRAGGNVLPACKNIGVTHLTNGAYRLHPTEWAIGEAAATLAAFCLDHDLTPAQVAADPWWTWRLQARLVRRGCPVFWAVDVQPRQPAFVPTQLLLIRDVLVAGESRAESLDIGLDQPIGDSIDRHRLTALADELNGHIGSRVVTLAIDADTTWRDLCALFAPAFFQAL